MQALLFEDVFTLLTGLQLRSDELGRLRAWLASIVDPSECLALIARAAGIPPCPRCRCERAHRCGSASGLQRFRCCHCARTYNALSGTPLARLRKKEKWLSFLQCLLESRTVRDAANQVDVHRTTSFRWRHRFIPGAMHERALQLTGIVEADETYMLESQKGSRHLTRPPRRRGGVATRRGISRAHECLLVARDRTAQTLDFHTARGPLCAAQLDACLRPVLASDVLLISDSALAYKTFATHTGITHETVNLRSGIRVRAAIHIQNVKGWHGRFKTWVARFKAIASRYLINYSGWQRILDDRHLTSPALLLCAAVQFGKRSGHLLNKREQSQK